MYTVSRAALIAAVTLALTLAASPRAHALTASELKCQQTIGKEGAKYAKKRHTAIRKCEDVEANGQTCDTAKRDTQIANAEAKLSQKLAQRCGAIVLENLGFPGQCPDSSGPPFSSQDLFECIRDSHLARVDMAVATEYPGNPAPLSSTELGCQKRIGVAGQRFISAKLKHRQKCLDRQLKGTIAPSVNCRAQVPPNGPGTGDASTDSRITKAITKLQSQLDAKCTNVTLENLGFPGMCPDPNGPPFSSVNLRDCIEDTHEAKADEMIDFEFPVGGTPATPTPTPTATGGGPATPTATPTGGGPATPTATSTPGGSCVLPNPIPEVLSFLAKPGIDLDTGWTGISHDVPGVDDGALTAVRLSNCDLNTSSPTCGQCDTEGPIAFPGPSKNCRCFNIANRDTSSLTTCDPEMPSSCGGGETCECFYGPPLPISSGAVPVCVINRFTATLTGTANIADGGPHAGEGAALVRLESSVHNGLTVDQPCPTCENDTTPRDGVQDGQCSGGPRNGLACDSAGTNAFFGDMAFECPPARAANIGNLDIKFNQATTGTTQLAANIPCTAFGFSNLQCPCDTCATAAGEACNSNADCPGGAECGGLRCVGGTNNGTACADDSECPGGGACNRIGTATQPNQCSNGVCVANPSNPSYPDEARCQNAPNDNLCSIETFRGCVNATDCNPPPSGNCPNCLPNQTCGLKRRECFRDPIVRGGTPGTQNAVLAATFCIPPTASSSVNQVAGLPGPGAVLQPTRIFRSGAQCGNGVVNAGETCDPPMDAACPGECQLNCQCPGAGMCGDGTVNQPSEECDGEDDAACPGACQGNCLCGAFCGDDVIDPGEECDGTAGGPCPGNCQPTCQCPTCGDGVNNQPSEQCDGGDDQACPGACQGDCTCGPFCGDGVQNGSEQCDGSDTGACPGTCEDDCTCAPFCGNGTREAGENCDPGPPADDALCPGECQAGCTCPAIGELSFVVAPGADLDTGWTGTSHDFGVQVGSTIPGEIAACDNVTDFECTFFANVGSFCSGDASLSCTETTQCPLGQTCVINTYGPPLPLSSGGVPVCVINRHAGDVTGTYNLQTGTSEIRVPLNSLVHLATDVNRPCPICDCGAANPQDCTIGQTGTCSDNPLQSCTVEGTGPFGPTTNDCPPSSATNISGGGLNLAFDPASTGTVTFPSNQPCDGNGFTGFGCWCDGQTQPSACNSACDGGSRDGLSCTSDANCPGAPVGACRPLCRQIVGEPVGEGQCAAGPVDRTCSQAHQVTCTADSDCIGLGTCETEVRRCFLDPIVREGTPGTSSNVMGATFCIPATSSPAVNNTAGLPGPGAILFPNTVNAQFCGDGAQNRPSEECDPGNPPGIPADDTNCPGACAANCTCTTTCGDGNTEFGEQCDPGMPPTVPADDTACPTQCGAAGSATECTCPALCGDGFAAPTEQCDPGGIPPGTPPSDAACPGQCLPTCECTPAVCGNGTIEPGELCELPNINCGPLQLCNAAPPTGCQACVP